MQNGYDCYIAFIIAMPGVRQVLPNVDTHPEFGTALEEVKAVGEKVLYLTCDVNPDSLTITECIETRN